MSFRHVNFALLLLGVAVISGCGAPGVPIPPQLELPRPVSDLHAFRKGNAVHLSWTTPTQTTEHRNLRKDGTADVCRAIATALRDCGTPVAQLSFRPVLHNAKPNQNTQAYADQLPSNLSAPPTSFITYALNVLNQYGRSAGLSNRAQVSAAPALPPPGNFRVQLTADGVRVSWNPVVAPQIPALRFVYRIYRRELGSNKDAIAGEVPVAGDSSPSNLDHNFEWEKTYEYHATVVTVVAGENGAEQQVEGDDTPAVRVVAYDIFPPAIPTGLQAVFSGPGQKPFIDLVWTPNTEADLGGYNVYRGQDGGEWKKMNSDLIKTPAFRDDEVQPGQTYSYVVSAVDVRGNESPRSEPTSESVPAQ